MSSSRSPAHITAPGCKHAEFTPLLFYRQRGTLVPCQQSSTTASRAEDPGDGRLPDMGPQLEIVLL